LSLKVSPRGVVLTGVGLETLCGLETIGEEDVLILDVLCEVLFLNLELNLPEALWELFVELGVLYDEFPRTADDVFIEALFLNLELNLPAII